MQEREGLQHCLHKMQSLTISKQPWPNISRIQLSPLVQGNTTPPPCSPSQARNFFATKSCHHLVTTATQPTLKPNQKKKKKKTLTNSANVGYRSHLGRTQGDLLYFFFFFFFFCLVFFLRYSYTDMLTSHNYTEQFFFYNYYNDLKFFKNKY